METITDPDTDHPTSAFVAAGTIDSHPFPSLTDRIDPDCVSQSQTALAERSWELLEVTDTTVAEHISTVHEPQPIGHVVIGTNGADGETLASSFDALVEQQVHESIVSHQWPLGRPEHKFLTRPF